MESGLLTNLSFRRPESCEKNFYFYCLRYLFIPIWPSETYVQHKGLLILFKNES